MRFQLSSLVMISIAAPPILAGLWYVRDELVAGLMATALIVAWTALPHVVVGTILGLALAVVIWLLGYGNSKAQPED